MKKDQNPIEVYNMKRKIINTQKSPKPIGPYNQAVLSDKTLYISGQIALDPETMKLKNDSIEEETNRVMLNLKNILSECDMDFSNVVKSTIFLKSMDFFGEVNEVYGNFFLKGNEPARETIAVKQLPMDVNVEISMIAVR